MTPSSSTAADLPFAKDAGLRDMNVGRWASQSLQEVSGAEPAALAAWMGDPAAAANGGESVVDLVARVAAWMADQAAQGGRVAPVAQAAVVAALGAGAGSFWRIDAAPLTAAAFSHDGRRWSLMSLMPEPTSG